MSIVIRAPGPFNQDTFERAATFTDDDSDKLTVDLRACRFADTFSLVMLLTIMTMRVRNGFPVHLLLPMSKGTCTYLSRMHFFSLIPEEVQLDSEPPTVTERLSPWLVELTPLNIHDGEYAIEQICNFVWPQLPPQLSEQFVEALAEMGSNVVYHSEADVGFVAGQRFERAYHGRAPPRLQLVVADAGIGIAESLATGRPEFASLSDEEAILKAMQEGVTSKPEKHSGVGLSTVARYADMFGGVLRIRSGRGIVVQRKGRQTVSSVPGLSGTVVAVELASPGRREG